MEIQPLLYTVEDIQILRRCGRDKAYAIAKRLPHFVDGNKILVFKKDFDEDFEKIRQEVLEKSTNCNEKAKSNVYGFRKLS